MTKHNYCFLRVTGAAKAVTRVILFSTWKTNSNGIPRTNSNTVSVLDLTVRIKKRTYFYEIKDTMKLSYENELKGILVYTEEAVVSMDFITDKRTSIFIIDAKAGIMLTNNLVKVISWYDNETGYSNKLIDLASYIVIL